jgi:hypothetical protein
MVFTNGLFINNKDLSSQIGFVLIIINKDTNNNICFIIYRNLIYWSSIRYKRVIQSVLALEIYNIISGFNIAFSISTILEIIII